jgi:hypothetical protein
MWRRVDGVIIDFMKHRCDFSNKIQALHASRSSDPSLYNYHHIEHDITMPHRSACAHLPNHSALRNTEHGALRNTEHGVLHNTEHSDMSDAE